MKNRYYPKVENIELSDKNPKRRLILAVVFGIIAAVSISIAVGKLLLTEPGWQTVTSSAKESCAGEFVLQYKFGDDATAVSRKVTSLYTSLTESAYKLFSADKSFENVKNLRYISLNPNTEIELEPELYSALELMGDRRELYYAPIYSEYSSLYFSQTDDEARVFDPELDADECAYIDELLVYVNDPGMIKLEYLGENKVRLRVSDKYLEFAKECGFVGLIDFGWMKNAFIADYIASKLAENGFTDALLTSSDGFVRNLSGDASVYPINDRVGMVVCNAANAQFPGGTNVVVFRDFMLNRLDKSRYYEYSDGTIRTPYIASDGRCHNSVSELILFSGEKSCAELLLEGLDVYVSDDFDEGQLSSGRVWCKDYTINAVGNVEIGQIYSKDVTYTLNKK